MKIMSKRIPVNINPFMDGAIITFDNIIYYVYKNNLKTK
jgi:hypothetical protein